MFVLISTVHGIVKAQVVKSVYLIVHMGCRWVSDPNWGDCVEEKLDIGVLLLEIPNVSGESG